MQERRFGDDCSLAAILSLLRAQALSSIRLAVTFRLLDRLWRSRRTPAEKRVMHPNVACYRSSRNQQCPERDEKTNH